MNYHIQTCKKTQQSQNDRMSAAASICKSHFSTYNCMWQTAGKA